MDSTSSKRVACGSEHLRGSLGQSGQLKGLSGQQAEAAQLLQAGFGEGLIAAHLALQLSRLNGQLLVGGACASGAGITPTAHT